MALCDYIRLQYPRYFPYIIKITNEGKRSRLGNWLMAKMGMHVGASDIFIALPLWGFHGLFIEVKPPKYKVTPSKKKHHDEQMAFILKMRDKGYVAEMGIGLKECISIVDTYFKYKSV